MTKPGKLQNSVLAVSVMATLMASLFFVGIVTAVGSNKSLPETYAAMMGDKGNGTMMMDRGNSNSSNSNMSSSSKVEMMSNSNSSSMTMMVENGYHAIKGQISNVQLDSNGMPVWIESGVWLLRVHVGDNNTLQSAHFIAKLAMVKTDGTGMHKHMIYGFQPTQFTTEQNGTVHVLNGTATVTMKGEAVEGVPLTIKIFNKTVIGLWIGPAKISGHFGSGPVYGILSMEPRSSMMEMGSMMMQEGNQHGASHAMGK